MAATQQQVRELAQLDARDVAALTEPMDVYVDDPETTDDQVAVYHRDTRRIVTPDVPVCDCPDMVHRRPADGCKHIRRVEYVLGSREIPPGVDETALDSGVR